MASQHSIDAEKLLALEAVEGAVTGPFVGLGERVVDRVRRPIGAAGRELAHVGGAAERGRRLVVGGEGTEPIEVGIVLDGRRGNRIRERFARELRAGAGRIRSIDAFGH